jgi:hypothetical protein
MVEASPRFLPLAQGLVYAGSLPFLACALLAWAGPIAAVPGVDPVAVAIGYGAVIASFIAGIHWAVHLFAGTRGGDNLLVASNVVALVAWGALLIGGAWGLALLIACFATLFALDRRLHRRGVWPAWFFRLRRNITAIVTCALLVTIAAALSAG